MDVQYAKDEAVVGPKPKKSGLANLRPTTGASPYDPLPFHCLSQASALGDWSFNGLPPRTMRPNKTNWTRRQPYGHSVRHVRHVRPVRTPNP